MHSIAQWSKPFKDFIHLNIREYKTVTTPKFKIHQKFAYIKLNEIKPYIIPNRSLFLMLKDVAKLQAGKQLPVREK